MDTRGKQKPRTCREDASTLKEKFLELKDDLRAGRITFAKDKLRMIAGSYHSGIQKSPRSLGKNFRYLSEAYPAIKEMTDISSEHKHNFLLVLKMTAITMLSDYSHFLSKLNEKGVEDLANGIACFF